MQLGVKKVSVKEKRRVDILFLLSSITPTHMLLESEWDGAFIPSAEMLWILNVWYDIVATFRKRKMT